MLRILVGLPSQWNNSDFLDEWRICYHFFPCLRSKCRIAIDAVIAFFSYTKPTLNYCWQPSSYFRNTLQGHASNGSCTKASWHAWILGNPDNILRQYWWNAGMCTHSFICILLVKLELCFIVVLVVQAIGIIFSVSRNEFSEAGFEICY